MRISDWSSDVCSSDLMSSTDSAIPSFQGSMVALVTPMHQDGSLDFDAYRKLIDWHVEQGTDVLAVVGTSGESPTISVDEQAELIRVAVEHSAGRLPVIAGVGGKSTSEAVHLSRHAKAVGVCAGLWGVA